MVVCRSLSFTKKRSRILYRFIIDGVITLPIALYGFVVFPNVPATTNVFYISEEVIYILETTFVAFGLTQTWY